MGSKRAMLANGLGHVLANEMDGCQRFLDLFSGSGAVADFVAKRFPVSVLASDLQTYSVVLANSFLLREKPLNSDRIWKAWYRRAHDVVAGICGVPNSREPLTRRAVEAERKWCGTRTDLPITRAYGGFYFSASQSIWIDALRRTLPAQSPSYDVALGALIRATSQCAAAPGHTAQPFQPTATGLRFIQEAWCKSILERTKQNFHALSASHARRKGLAMKGDALEIAKQARMTDLVFIDPPYSGVHYSRFYHVLETIAIGDCGAVSGKGRYPSEECRPRSQFSIQSQAIDALDRLLRVLAESRCKIVMTFPEHKCSNGLSGAKVQRIAAQHFAVRKMSIMSRFSTLGGTGDNRGDEAGRAARRHARELVLTLSPE